MCGSVALQRREEVPVADSGQWLCHADPKTHLSKAVLILGACRDEVVYTLGPLDKWITLR